MCILCLSSAKQKLKEVEENFAACREKFMHTMDFFDFTPKKKAGESAAHEFFSVWTPFCTDFKVIWRNELQKIRKEKLKDAEKIVKQKRSFLKNMIVKKPRQEGGLVRELIANRNFVVKILT